MREILIVAHQPYTELVEAPQINNVTGHYQGTFSGDTYSKTVNNYYEQVQNETLNINEHSLEAPTYAENIDQLDEEVNNLSVNSQTILLQGGSFIHNGTLFLNGDFEFCAGSGTSPQAFVQPMKRPNQSIDSDDLALFVATVFGEADLSSFFEYEAGKFYYAENAVQGKITPTLINQYNERMGYIRHHQKPPFNYPKLHQVDSSDIAIQAVASVIKNRMNNFNTKLCKSVVGARLQFDCFIDPNTLDLNNIAKNQWEKSSNFIQGYAYLAQNRKTVTVPYLAKDQIQNLIRVDRLMNIFNLVEGIYKGNIPPTTNATGYFSPVAQILTRGRPPIWQDEQVADIMKARMLKQEDDFYFVISAI